MLQLCGVLKKVKKHQQKIEMVLGSKKIAFETIDISSDEDAKNRMRELSGDPKALSPQICNGDQYCGVSKQIYCCRCI